jgi:hypothetical protein
VQWCWTYSPPHFGKHRTDACPREPGLNDKAKIGPRCRGRNQRDRTGCTSSLDHKSDIVPVILSFDANLSQGHQCSVLSYELFRHSSGLRVRIAHPAEPEEIDGRALSDGVICQFQTDFFCAEWCH